MVWWMFLFCFFLGVGERCGVYVVLGFKSNQYTSCDAISRLPGVSVFTTAAAYRLIWCRDVIGFCFWDLAGFD